MALTYPSAAFEGTAGHATSSRHGMVTGARSQLERHTDRLEHRSRTLRGLARGQVDTHGRHLGSRSALLGRSSLRSVEVRRSELEARAQRLAALPSRRLLGEDLRVAHWRRLLGAYDYRRQLERGYSVTRDATGRVVRSAAELPPGSRMVTRLADGFVATIVTDDDATNTAHDRLDDEGEQ